MSADDLGAEIVDEPTVQQPPRTEPLTDPPPRHDPFAHGIGGTYQPPPSRPANGGGVFSEPPPRPGDGPRKLRGDERRLHEKLVGTYATVGLVVCAAAETRMQVLGPSDPIGAPHDPARERARRATVLMNQAGVNTVNMSSMAADAWLEVAKEVPAVKVALDRFMEGGAIMGLIAAHAMILIPYGVAAGWVPEIIGENLAKVGSAMGAASGANGN